MLFHGWDNAPLLPTNGDHLTRCQVYFSVCGLMGAYLPSTKGIYDEREAKVLLYDRDFSPHWLRGDNNMVCVWQGTMCSCLPVFRFGFSIMIILAE